MDSELDKTTIALQDDAEDVTRWTIDRLIDHILSMHHTYVRAALPAIAKYLAKLGEVHGARHPELRQVASCFGEVAVVLEQHMLKEEQILFPYVRELARDETTSHFGSPFGTVENPIRMMEHEHEDAGEALRTIRELTNQYEAPVDGCLTYRVCMAELARFEQDLHRHVHLENNVLFPRAVELERGALAR